MEAESLMRSHFFPKKFAAFKPHMFNAMILAGSSLQPEPKY